MIIGFTGTSRGMTPPQFDTVFVDLLFKFKPLELHHGDCEGADKQAHFMAVRLNARIVIHPPDNDKKRAFCSGADVMCLPLPYLVRNREIVKAGIQGLIATPRWFEEELRSGTWATVRYARKIKRHIWIVWPDGTIREEQL